MGRFRPQVQVALSLQVTFTLCALTLLAALALVAAVESGIYDVSAVRQHTHAVYTLLDAGKRSSVRARAIGTSADLMAAATTPGQLQRGAQCYRRHCQQCHGAPGQAPESFALGMLPVPANLVNSARKWTPHELRWVISNGIKMTGMPAWRYRLTDADIATIAAFVAHLPQQTPASYLEASAGFETCAVY
ncbi:MAG: cytochrome c [Burkholderiales bacterium]|nr:cytochrome c [Burkholderiales bacterium]